MSVRTICPFCNSQIIERVAVPRVVCPRCGEASMPTAWEDSAEAVAAATTIPSAFPRRAFFVSLAVSVLAVTGGLLYFQPWQSGPAPSPGPRASDATIPPPTLDGLRYLPASANVIIALQPAAMERSQRIEGDPRARWKSLGLPDAIVDVFAAAQHNPDDVEQIVVGLTFALDKPLPGVTIYVRFTSANRMEAIKQALKVERKPISGRAVYDTKVSMLLATEVDDRTWLLGLGLDDLATADKPAGGALAAEIAKLEPASYAWLVTDRRNWAEASPLLRLEGGKKLAARLARIRGLSAALCFARGRPLTRIEAQFDTPANAEETRTAIIGKLPADSAALTDSTLIIEFREPAYQSAAIFRELLNELTGGGKK